MQSIPVKVKNVNVYPYIDWHGGGIGPVIPPVIEGASGTYAVGTLTTYVFYNLDLTGGKHTCMSAGQPAIFLQQFWG